MFFVCSFKGERFNFNLFLDPQMFLKLWAGCWHEPPSSIRLTRTTTEWTAIKLDCHRLLLYLLMKQCFVCKIECQVIFNPKHQWSITPSLASVLCYMSYLVGWFGLLELGFCRSCRTYRWPWDISVDTRYVFLQKGAENHPVFYKEEKKL